MKLLKKLVKTVFGKKGSSQGTPFFVPEAELNQKATETYVETVNSRIERKVGFDAFPKGPPPIAVEQALLKGHRAALLDLTRDVLSKGTEVRLFPTIDILRSAVAIRMLKNHEKLEIVASATFTNVPGLKHELQEAALLRTNASKLLSSHRTEERYYDLLALTLLELSLFQKINELENGSNAQS